MPKLYRLLKKTRIREYRRGWAECSSEKDMMITQQQTEKKQQHDSYIKENSQLVETYKREISTINDKSRKEIERLRIEFTNDRGNLKRKTTLLLTEKTKEHRRQIDYVKSEAQKRINEIKSIAEIDVRRANERESEYQALIAKLKMLFHEGSVKFLITAEEQESLMNDMTKTIHRKNEFVRMSENFNKILKDHSKVTDRLKVKQIDSK